MFQQVIFYPFKKDQIKHQGFFDPSKIRLNQKIKLNTHVLLIRVKFRLR